jgi:hypothetical protein
VDDRVLVGVLDPLADQHEQMEPLLRRQSLSIAELGDRHPLNMLHGKVRPPAFGRSGAEDLCHVRVVHHGQRLAFGLEPGDDPLCVHPALDDLQGHTTANRSLLLGQVDDTHSALAKNTENLVGSDAVTLCRGGSRGASASGILMLSRGLGVESQLQQALRAEVARTPVGSLAPTFRAVVGCHGGTSIGFVPRATEERIPRSYVPLQKEVPSWSLHDSRFPRNLRRSLLQ